MIALPLVGRVQPYAWGSREAIARIQGRRAPSAGPEAELWLGAHAQLPADVLHEGGPRESLAALVARAPAEVLGADVAARFRGELPFLLKVLAADAPLSLQAHPDDAQAAEGFAREEAAGVPRDAPTRTYRDRHAKPELLVALSPFEALSGFRAPDDAARHLAALGLPALAPLVGDLARDARAAPESSAGPPALARALDAILRWPAAERAELARAATEAARARQGASPAFAWAARLGDAYPGDTGVVASLLLEHVTLAPGEGLYLDAGNLHAYLRGVGVEIMASSDNVLRGGLTTKHVDVPELLRVLRFDGRGPVRPAPTPAGPFEVVYPTPSPTFELARVELPPAAATSIDGRGGPAIVLATAGAATSGPLAARGGAAFVPAGAGLDVAAGPDGLVAFVARVGQLGRVALQTP